MIRPRIFPVIHLSTLALLLANAARCVRAGVDGVFLIDMSGRDDWIDDACGVVRKSFPELRIGVNRLSVGAEASVQRSLAIGVEMTWADNSGITSVGPSPMARSISGMVAATAHEFFAGVAFKYQQPEIDPGRAAKWATDLGLVPTTSGDATGVPAAQDKIEAMREALGVGQRLAIASGITPENVSRYRHLATDFLVATGISIDEHELDPQRLAMLVRAVHSS